MQIYRKEETLIHEVLHGIFFEAGFEEQDEDGNPVMRTISDVDFNESDMVDGSIIAEVKKGKKGVSIKLADKMKALDKLAMYFDLVPDNFKRKIEKEEI